MDVVRVSDVYDMAANIGKDFEGLIDKHGPDEVSSLMTKVINVLENLEKLASERASEDQTLENLRSTIIHYEHEEVKKNEERIRHSNELEQIEDHYKQEMRDLLSMVKKLQDENRKLQSSLAAATEQRDSAFSEDESYFEVDLVNRLQTMVEKQRSQIKCLDQKLLDVKIQNDELKCQNEKFIGCTRDLRRKNRTWQNQLHILVDERSELTAKVYDQAKDLQLLSKKLGVANKECEELSGKDSTMAIDKNDPNCPRFSLPELRDLLQERNILKAQISDLLDELSFYRPPQKSKVQPDSGNTGRNLLATSFHMGFHELTAATTASMSSSLHLNNMVTKCDCSYHANINDLSNCFEDSNLEDESEPRWKSTSEEKCESPTSTFILKNEQANEEMKVVQMEDLPVQGPLPEDPSDAPWRRNESGIRKLFAFITTRVSTVVSSAELQDLKKPVGFRLSSPSTTVSSVSEN